MRSVFEAAPHPLRRGDPGENSLARDTHATRHVAEDIPIGSYAYAYEAPSAGYADTLVPETGFVTRYPGLWEVER